MFDISLRIEGNSRMSITMLAAVNSFQFQYTVNLWLIANHMHRASCMCSLLPPASLKAALLLLSWWIRSKNILSRSESMTWIAFVIDDTTQYRYRIFFFCFILMIFTRATSIVSDPQFHVSITSQTKRERVLFIQSMLSARPLRVYIHHTVERTSKEAKIWKQNTLMSHPSSTECVRSAPISQLAMETQCKHTQHTPFIIQQNSYINRKTESALLFISVSERWEYATKI